MKKSYIYTREERKFESEGKNRMRQVEGMLIHIEGKDRSGRKEREKQIG